MHKYQFYKLLFLFCSILMTYTIQAQERVNGGPNSGKFHKPAISGKVIDADSGEPLEFATVTLFSALDSSIITGGITDSKGLFSIDSRPGKFFIKIEFISYQSKSINNIELGQGKIQADLGIIQLSLDANMLGEIDVRAERSELSLTLDKKVFNVGKDLANTGGTASDILDNVPSVAVDIEGNVTLRGSGGVRILVDGKPSGLVGLGGTNGLKSIPANMIEKVEVITNPSARYEAEGMAGIINIVLKKEQKKGLNGSFDFTVGYPNLYGAAINLNYRKNKLNFFTNLGVNYRKAPGGGKEYQEFYSDGATLITEQDDSRERGGITTNIRFGADYFFTPKDILTTSFLYRVGDENNDATVIYKDHENSLDNPTKTVTRTDDEFEDESSLEYALSYKKLFTKKNQEFTIDLRYQDNTETEGSDFVNNTQYTDPTTIPTPDVHQRSNNSEGERRTTAQIDYIHPFSKEGKLEFGVRSSFRNIRNDYLVEDQISAGEWIRVDSISNDFEYNEDIHALYAIYGDKQGKFSWQLGLRTEYSEIKTELLNLDSVNFRKNIGFFPSAHFTVELPKNNAIQLSYSRRVNRPRFWFLNPFFTFSDSRNYFGGNPNLNPEYTDASEIGHIKYWDKASLSSSIFYRRTTGVIERLTIANEAEGTTRTQPQNLSTRNDYGLEFVFSYSPVKWLKLNGDYNFFRSITEGQYEEKNYDSDTYTWTSRITSRFTIMKKTDIQLRFNYRAPRNTTQGKRKAMYNLDIGASRDIFKNKGTLTLSIRDVFNTRKRRWITDTDNYYSESSFQWRSRQASLTINYRLNQKKQRGPKRGGNMEGGGEF